MSDAVDRGITVTEISAVDQPIDVAPETTAAFVGRALRGPLDTPILVHHFGEFRRRFGDVWSRSSLGPAVKQYFEHGGKRLVVVRVANNARGAMICLPAAGSALVLRAVEPGSSETLRAAVDYDGLTDDPGDESKQQFNLTLQRVDPNSGLIVDQEMYRRLSFVDGNDAFVADILLNSTIARVEHPYPTHRPNATVSRDNRFDLEWVGHVQQGTDGSALSDYDLIGSREKGTGLFALDETDCFDLLYLPAPGKGVDAGPAAVLAAELYCRERGAMLIVDPLAQADSAEAAAMGVRGLGYASPNIVSYFPRIYERGDPDRTPRAAGGALAGLLCKLDRNYGPWIELDKDALHLGRNLIPCDDVDDEGLALLARTGINIIKSGPAGRARISGSTTMGRGSEPHRMFASLPVRRLCLRIVNTIDIATRWTVFEQPDRKLTERIQRQVRRYLSDLYSVGAFQSDRYVVQCDAGIAKHADQLQHGVTLLLVFHPFGCAEPISFTLHQTVSGCRVASTAFAPVAQHCA